MAPRLRGGDGFDLRSERRAMSDAAGIVSELGDADPLAMAQDVA